tara:strand:+ start:326 stop:565 length:240 start_codon:yes stop_codon:yes gene_type:complete
MELTLNWHTAEGQKNGLQNVTHAIGLIDTWRNYLLKCRVCKIDLNEDYGVYENADYQKRYYCFKHWKTYYGFISQTSTT